MLVHPLNLQHHASAIHDRAPYHNSFAHRARPQHRYRDPNRRQTGFRNLRDSHVRLRFSNPHTRNDALYYQCDRKNSGVPEPHTRGIAATSPPPVAANSHRVRPPLSGKHP